MTPAESLCAAADRFDGPVGEQLSAMRDGLARGASLDATLLDWVAKARSGHGSLFGRDRSPDPEDVELLVCAIRFGEPQGAGLVEAFEGVAVALIDRAELESELRALSSQAWASVAVLCALPVVGMVILMTIEPEVTRVLVGTPLGLACVVVAAALDVGAVLLARRLVVGVLR